MTHPAGSGPTTTPARRDAGNTDPLRHAVRLGTWRGVPVSANWTVAVTLLLFSWLLAAGVLPSARPGHSTASYWLLGIATAIALLATLLAHELAHAVCARHYGLRVRRVVLWMLGGVTEYDGMPPTPRAEAWIASSGPLTSIVLGGVCAALGWLVGAATLVGTALMWLAGVSVLLGVFNLLPGAPLDGGRLLRALLWRRSGDRARASVAAARVGRVLGAVLIGFGVLETLAGGVDGLWLMLIGWFILGSAAQEQYVAGLEQLHGLSAGDVMAPAALSVPDWWTVQVLLERLSPQDAKQPAFPVVDFGGNPVGVFTLADVQRVPAGRRSEVRIRDFARRAVTLPVGAPTGELLPLLSRNAVLVVVDGQRPVGVLTAADLARAARLAQLGWQRPPGHDQDHAA